jgi:hypothetical protein
MRMLLLFAAAALVVAPVAMASISTCPSGGFDQYLLVPTFTCTTGNLLFSNFSYSASANPPGNKIPASGITVTPLLTTGDEGFQFTSNWSVSSSGGNGSSLDTVIFFTVSTLNHAATIDDLFLSDNGTQTLTGIAQVTEQWCANNAIANCPIGGLNQIFVSNPGTPNNATAVFSPVTSLSISKDIGVASGTNGTATITTVTNNFSQVGVPEPASFLMLGGGLLGVGLLRKRARRQ